MFISFPLCCFSFLPICAGSIPHIFSFLLLFTTSSPPQWPSLILLSTKAHCLFGVFIWFSIHLFVINCSWIIIPHIFSLFFFYLRPAPTHDGLVWSSFRPSLFIGCFLFNTHHSYLSSNTYKFMYIIFCLFNPIATMSSWSPFPPSSIVYSQHSLLTICSTSLNAFQ